MAHQMYPHSPVMLAAKYDAIMLHILIFMKNHRLIRLIVHRFTVPSVNISPMFPNFHKKCSNQKLCNLFNLPILINFSQPVVNIFLILVASGQSIPRQKMVLIFEVFLILLIKSSDFSMNRSNYICNRFVFKYTYISNK